MQKNSDASDKSTESDGLARWMRTFASTAAVEPKETQEPHCP